MTSGPRGPGYRDTVVGEFLTQGIPIEAEDARGLDLIAAGASEHQLDKRFFEFRDDALMEIARFRTSLFGQHLFEPAID